MGGEGEVIFPSLLRGYRETRKVGRLTTNQEDYANLSRFNEIDSADHHHPRLLLRVIVG